MAIADFLTRTLASVIVFALLTSCSQVSSGGISSESASARIESATGLQVEYIDLHKFRDGFTETRNVFISVKANTRREDISAAVLVDYVARMAWAVTDLQPNLFIGIDFEPANDNSPNWLEAARSAGLEPESSPHSNYVTLTVESASKAFGPWPGPVPNLPRQNDLSHARQHQRESEQTP
jgi:hypothetical protein